MCAESFDYTHTGMAHLVEREIWSLPKVGLRDKWIMKGFGVFLANASNPFIQFCLSCIWKSRSTQRGTLQPTQEAGQSDRLQAQTSVNAEAASLLPLRQSPERWPWLLAWGWPTQLRGGVSHPIGRKSEWEPRAPPLFLAIPNIWCELLRRHHDCNFGLCHIPFPWAFRSSFFWLFSIMFTKIEFLMIKIRFLPHKWNIDFFTKSWQYSSFQGWLHRSLSLAESVRGCHSLRVSGLKWEEINLHVRFIFWCWHH